MNSAMFTWHKNAANMTPQQKKNHKNLKKNVNELKLKSVPQVIC